MASATLYSPNSHGPPPPKRPRQSFQSTSMRSMSASSAAVTAVRRLRARAFIGHSERSVGETGVHFGTHGAGHGARLAIPWPAAAAELGSVFADGERVPHTQWPLSQHRHAPARSVAIDLLAGIGRVERNEKLLEFQVHVLHEQPRSQRP